MAGRHTGPWPVRNDERAVRDWLHTWLKGDEADAQVRWLLDEVTATDRGTRLMGYVYSEAELNVLAEWAKRCAAGEPIQHVTGFTHFMGLRIACDRRALIPRPETEELAAWCVRALRGAGPGRVCDAGTGTGCLALALKHALPAWEVEGTDRSEAALDLARENAARLDLAVAFHQRAFAALAAESARPFDLIVSNPPYIPRSEFVEMEAVVTEYDPDLALFVEDEDPLVHYRTLVEQSEAGALGLNGILAFEIHERAADEVVRLFGAPWREVSVHHDLQGRPRMVTAQRAAP